MIKVDKESEDCSNCGAENKQKAREKATSALLEFRSGADFRTVSQKYSSRKDKLEDKCDDQS